jgi:carboxymethylenebutenolidase
MRILSVICTLWMITTTIYSQQSSCCTASSVQQFAELGKDLTFIIAHEEPLPFTLAEPSGKTIKYDTPDGVQAQGYYIEGKKGHDKWIFVIQEWWGLNDYIKNQAEILHKAYPDAHILCLDMYDGQVASKREEASALMQGAKPERLENIVKGASAYAGPKAKIASIGWCFGGAWSSKTAVLLGDKMVASVIYYGMPVRDEEMLKNVSCPTLGIFANQDGWITPAVATEFADKLKAQGKSVVIHQYEAAHGFANPSNPKYDQKNAEDAWSKTIAFFNQYL